MGLAAGGTPCSSLRDTGEQNLSGGPLPARGAGPEPSAPPSAPSYSPPRPAEPAAPPARARTQSAHDARAITIGADYAVGPVGAQSQAALEQPAGTAADALPPPEPLSSGDAQQAELLIA